MDDFQLFDGVAFGSQISPVVLLDCLPPCACGAPADGPLLNAIFALLDGGFAGVRELKGDTPTTYLNLVLAYTDQANTRPLWLSIDPSSIEGQAILALLHEAKSGTTRTDRDLAAHAIHMVETAYTHAGRSEEFYAAAQRALEIQRQAEVMQ
ncbi:hypothetical protein CDR19_11290 [Ectopseudomonas toyotomiensis]|uniref:Uncharacterized protein n=1 Tax=Ectopseudomonas toyotomiensis TaxID=554344 RepID=A0A1I5W1I8_9GAMM|nr:hypothetical protein [Pseudomonas toyotomiensis]PIA72813.1 hypothetical protein CDR19_11290 [Pseudomonas toyotomiensis]SFQ13116.1 hypothetical protein SAMN05216177_10852 [Pseudomonas toyotomiensis]